MENDRPAPDLPALRQRLAADRAVLAEERHRAAMEEAVMMAAGLTAGALRRWLRDPGEVRGILRCPFRAVPRAQNAEWGQIHRIARSHVVCQ